MSKRFDPADLTTPQEGELGSSRDKESLEALRASWQQRETATDPAATEGSAEQPATVMPRTCCPSCLTVFEVSPDLLAAYDTRVRCGECLGIFDALANLRRNKSADKTGAFPFDDSARQPNSAKADVASTSIAGTAPPGAHITRESDADVTVVEAAVAAAEQSDEDEEASLDTTYADFDLYSGEAELPEVAYFDQTLGHQESRLDETRNDDSFSETMFVRDMADQSASELPRKAASQSANEQTGQLGDELSTGNKNEQRKVSNNEPGNTTADRLVSHTAGENPSHAGFSSASTATTTLDADVSYILDDDSSEGSLQFVYDESVEAGGESVIAGHTPAREGLTPVRPDLRERKAAPTKPSWWKRFPRTWLVRLFLTFLIVALTLSLYAYRERDALKQNVQLRPVLSGICKIVGCELSPLVDLDALKVVKRSVFSHPTIENALVIDLAFVNEAQFDQAYPVLEIRLTDNRGGLVTQNNVPPVEYLQQWEPASLLGAGKRLDLSLTVEDPGQTATSFELSFR